MITKGTCITAQVVQHLEPGGIEKLAVDLAASAPRDEKHYIISLEPKKESAESFLAGIRCKNIEYVFMDKDDGIDLSLVKRLSDFFRLQSINSVHTHHIGPLLYAGMAARIAGVKHLVHTEHYCWHLENRKRRHIEKIALSFLHPVLVADAKHVAEGLSGMIGIEPDFIIKNGIDTNTFLPGDKHSSRCDLGLPIDAKIIGCAGRLEPVKGQRVLLEAFAKLEGPTFHLALAGTGSMESELRALAEYLGIADRTHFLGYVGQMPDFYRALDVFCLPSFNEGYPLSTLEAQSCGVPVVASDVGGVSETVCPGSGTMFAKGNHGELAYVLNEFLMTPRLKNPRRFALSVGQLKETVSKYGALRA